MSSFSSLKTAIANAIKQNGNQEITGNLLQGILLSIVETLGDSAINTLETGLSNEATTRGNADTNLNNLITGVKNNVDNGYVYAGIAIPTTSPVSGKVFYIATKAGTYTNLGGLSVTEGITILKYNGSTWSKEQVIYGDGGVFDVTAQNGGITFASLEALLGSGNLSTLIPTAVRKGGMSIKFVQTSDNKYVQFRCIADEFTTNVKQWQQSDVVNVSNQSGADFGISDEEQNSIVRFENGHIKTKNFDSSQDATEVKRGLMSTKDKTKLNSIENGADKSGVATNNSTSDLNISDESNNVIVQFKGGELRTKNFDSRKTTNISETDEGDLRITDESGKAVVLFTGGHIKTKNFDSRIIFPYKDYSVENVHFTVPVNTNILKNSSDTLSQQDSYIGNYRDNGVLMLPETYTKTGKPTRLVILFHGGGGGVTDHDSQTESSVLAKYLVANGYAVMDMDGMPGSWVETWWGDYDTLYADDQTALARKSYIKANNMGTSLAMECYIKGYQWVIENYNIAKDGVLVAGSSMGGLSSSNFVTMGSVPVLAHAVGCPVLDTYNQAFLHAWTPNQFPTGVISRYALSKLYGFSQKADISETTEIDGYDIKLIYNYDEDKVTGYNPIVNGMQTFLNGERVTSVGIWDYTTSKLNGESVTEYKDYPCPLKIWHCDDDATVNITVSERQINAIRNGGGKAWLRRFPSGGHAPLSAGSTITNPTGNTTLKGSSVGEIKPAIEEIFLFFNRFNNK